MYWLTCWSSPGPGFHSGTGARTPRISLKGWCSGGGKDRRKESEEGRAFTNCIFVKNGLNDTSPLWRLFTENHLLCARRPCECLSTQHKGNHCSQSALTCTWPHLQYSYYKPGDQEDEGMAFCSLPGSMEALGTWRTGARAQWWNTASLYAEGPKFKPWSSPDTAEKDPLFMKPWRAVASQILS